jgi:hypothetical protein
MASSKTAQLLQTAIAEGFDQSVPIGRDNDGQFARGIRVRCSQCEALVLQGTACHEHGCPNIARACRECGNVIPHGESCNCLDPAWGDEQDEQDEQDERQAGI